MLSRLRVRRHVPIALAAALALTAAPAGPAEARAAKPRTCGTVASGKDRYTVRQQTTNCKTAKRVASAALRKHVDRKGSARIGGFLCAPNKPGKPRPGVSGVYCMREAADDGLATIYVTLTAPAGRACGSMTLGPAHFSAIRVVGVSCATAKRLIDESTLAANRQGRATWKYGGYTWKVTPVDEVTKKLRGTRPNRSVSARWSVA